MLASFNTFLPAVLQSSHEPKSFRGDSDPDKEFDQGNTADEGEDDADPDNTMTVNDSGVKKREKKDKSPSETFIIVRPPPAKSNHPLNLQVQLVPPHARPPAGTTGSINKRQSLDFPQTPLSATFSEPNTPVTDGEQDSATLARSTSIRSDTSAYSSVASFSSTASSTTGRRMIIPLYNLQAHNVMTNMIVDAGTDAKIAKFQKRGLELIGLAILEPVEVWGANSGSPLGNVDNGRATSFSSKDQDSGLLHPGQTTRSRPVTPDPGSSALSVSSAGVDYKQDARPIPQITEAATSKRNIFGKLFKKKDTSILPTPSRTLTLPPAPPPPRNAKRISTISGPGTMPRSGSTPNASDPDAATPSSILRPPVLGIQPTSSSPRYPPIGRPAMYVWVVRRWLKGHDSSLIGGMIGKLGSQMPGIGQILSSTGLVEVRFEWKRGKTSAKRDKKKVSKGRTANVPDSRRGSTIIDSSNTSLEHNLTLFDGAQKDRQKPKRLSLISHQSISTSHTSEEDRERERARGGDDTGDESDPEDTETPWTCTLKVRRLIAPSLRSPTLTGAQLEVRRNAQEGGDQVIRTKLATLSPTPHHPKVVAMLKVPYPLPDIEVDNVLVRKRVLGPGGGVLRTTDDSGLVLTAEEIKDVVSSTGLWLVVREGFGGVGKVSRKGDGWRIRA